MKLKLGLVKEHRHSRPGQEDVWSSLCFGQRSCFSLCSDMIVVGLVFVLTRHSDKGPFDADVP